MDDDQTGGASAPHQPQPVQPRWCVVGNVVAQRLHGEQGELRPGSKLFTGGTRVYYESAFWGVAGESVTVRGIGRRPRRWITTTVQSTVVENWRAVFVYTPRVLRELQDEDIHGDEGEARTRAAMMNRISTASRRRLVARTPQECHRAAAGARVLAGPAPGDEQDQALVLYQGTEAVAGLVYQAAPTAGHAPRTAPFTWSSVWLRPLREPIEIGAGAAPGHPAQTVSVLFTAVQTRFPGHDLTALQAHLPARHP
jgi:hypothetical protein